MSLATYWLIAVPPPSSKGGNKTEKTAQELADDAALLRRSVDMKTEKLSQSFTFHIPKLKVGTLDALMSLSDDLVKMDQHVEQTVKRIEKSLTDLKKDAELLVNNQTPWQYIENFRWEAARFPIAAPLKQLAQKISEDVGNADEELRKRSAKYSEVEAAVAAIKRRETGTLLVKPLAGLIKEQFIVERDFITTVLVVVPKNKEEEFLSTYEIMERLAAEQEKKDAAAEEARKKEGGEEKAPRKARPVLSEDVKPKEKEEHSQSVQHATGDLKLLYPQDAEAAQRLMEAEEKIIAGEEIRKKKQQERAAAVQNVVPRSAIKLASDAEFVMYRVLVFKKGLHAFKTLCLQRRYTLRSHTHDPEQAAVDEDKKNELMDQESKLSRKLVRHCETTYSEVFMAWIHLKAIRLYVESVLRYGIPVTFTAILLKPKKGVASKLRKVLGEMFGYLADSDLTQAPDTSEVDFSGFGAEFFPYVYLGIDLDSNSNN